MADEIRNDIQEENRMEERNERPDPDHSYSTYPETSGRYPYGESSPAVVENTDDGIGAAEVVVAGAAVVGIGTIGYGIYRGVKWVVDKIRGVDDEEDDDEDEEDEKPRKSKKKQGKKKVTKKKTTSRKKAKEPDPDDEDDFEEEEDEESKSEE